jgi:hypothetical protein
MNDELDERDLLHPYITPGVAAIQARLTESIRRTAREIAAGAVPYPPFGAGLRDSILRVRKVAGYEQIAVDADPLDPDARRAAADQSRRTQAARLDAQLAEHDELLLLHPAEGIARAFLLEHQPHEVEAYAWRELVCRGCPEVYQNDGDTEPAAWPCGPWQLVNERTPR